MHKRANRRNHAFIGLGRRHAFLKQRFTPGGKRDGINLRAAEINADAVAHVRL